MIRSAHGTADAIRHSLSGRTTLPQILRRLSMPRYQDPGHHGRHAFTAFIHSDSSFVRFSLAPRFDPAQYLKTSHCGSGIAGEGRAGRMRPNRTVERVGHFPGRELYKMPVIRASGSKLAIVFRRAIPSSENRLRSESRVLSGSGSIAARTLSGHGRAARCRTNVTALPEMVEGRLHSVKPARPQEAPAATTLSDLTVFPKAL
jgi:hypothetical protein